MQTLLLLFVVLGILTQRAQAVTEVVLHNFGSPPNGATPYSGVVRDASGNLYGTTASGGPANAGVVYKLDASGRQTVLYSFTGGADGGQPYAGVTLDSAGNLYGTASHGGLATGTCGALFPRGCGVVYKLDASGQETVLYSFTGAADGSQPAAGLVRDPSGNLYGTASAGGAGGAGLVYKLDTTGHQTVLHSFTGGVDGGDPSFGSLLRDAAGNLYGTTQSGGAGKAGVVYKLDAAGHQTVLFSFPGGAGGSNPEAGVIRDSAGNLYGTTSGGGDANCLCGVVYKLDPSGHETALHAFRGADGGTPQSAGVVRDASGNLYGTTYSGGSNVSGVVYKLDAARLLTVLYSFSGGADGGQPFAGVLLGSTGNLYGTALSGGDRACPAAGQNPGCGVVYQIDPTGAETVLYTFPAGPDGKQPFSALLPDSAGNLYGATVAGGAFGAGVVYKLDPSGKETVLYTFTGGADGAAPFAGLVFDVAGNLYGTTRFGGSGSAGVVYKLDPGGHQTVLYSFTGAADGAQPYAGVIFDPAGNLYGTASAGGTAAHGVVYKLDAIGHLTVLYTFTGGADGAGPLGGVIRDSAGNLYGTTASGGAVTLACGFGGATGPCGVVYKLDAAGHETVLHSFTGGGDGAGPFAGLVRDAAGNLYGTTTGGGAANGGIVFKLDASGRETVLHSFTDKAGGFGPGSAVTGDGAGNLYGTTSGGGAGMPRTGVVYKIDAAGRETVLYSFSSGADGGTPYSAVIRDASGHLYGTAYSGGATGGGVIFKLVP